LTAERLVCQEILTKLGVLGQETLIKTLLPQKQPSIKQGKKGFDAVMKRTVLAIILILGLIILAILDCHVVGVQAHQVADPLQDYYDRNKPTMTPPSILVNSPQNHSIINTNSISLVFNVSGPQVIELSPDVKLHSSRLVKVYYKGDWQTEGQNLYFNEYESLDFLEFNTTLSNIPEGTRELQITAVGAVDITVAMFGFSYHPDANASIIFTVNSIQPTPSPELTPTPSQEPTSTPKPQQTEQLEIIIGVAFVVAVISAGLGLLVYLIKRK